MVGFVENILRLIVLEQVQGHSNAERQVWRSAHPAPRPGRPHVGPSPTAMVTYQDGTIFTKNASWKVDFKI